MTLAEQLVKIEQCLADWSRWYEAEPPTAKVFEDTRVFIENLPSLPHVGEVRLTVDAMGGLDVYFFSSERRPDGGAKRWVLVNFDNQDGNNVLINADVLPLEANWHEAAATFLQP